MIEFQRYLMIIWTWIFNHPEVVAPIVVYIAWNIIPRTPPKNRTWFALWSLGERLMLLSWDRWAGSWKSIGIISPDPVKWAKEADTAPKG